MLIAEKTCRAFAFTTFRINQVRLRVQVLLFHSCTASEHGLGVDRRGSFREEPLSKMIDDSTAVHLYDGPHQVLHNAFGTGASFFSTTLSRQWHLPRDPIVCRIGPVTQPQPRGRRPSLPKSHSLVTKGRSSVLRSTNLSHPRAFKFCHGLAVAVTATNLRRFGKLLWAMSQTPSIPAFFTTAFFLGTKVCTLVCSP